MKSRGSSSLEEEEKICIGRERMLGETGKLHQEHWATSSRHKCNLLFVKYRLTTNNFMLRWSTANSPPLPPKKEAKKEGSKYYNHLFSLA